MWIDSHCHTTHPEAFARARDAGVVGFVVVGCDRETSEAAIAVAHEHPDVFATVGLHPHEARHLDRDWDALVALARDPAVVGVGEAGFDLYYEHSPAAVQTEAFRRQIALAHELDLPLVIHSRDAWDLTFAALEEHRVPRRTVFHCFTGGVVEARRALALDCSLSYSGIVSFKAADDLRAAATITPPGRLLCETDSPYLAPVPMRGQPNEPAFVVHVGEALAAARRESVDDVARITAANARAMFSLP